MRSPSLSSAVTRLLARQPQWRAAAFQLVPLVASSSLSICSFSSDATKDRVLEQARKWQRTKPAPTLRTVQVDRSALKQPGAYPGRIASEEMLSKKTPENDLVHVLRTMIEVKGPLTVSEFMQRVRRSRNCLSACVGAGERLVTDPLQ